MPPLDTAEDSTEALEARNVVPGEKAVDVRQRSTHSPRERLVLGVALERVHPHDRERLPREPRHLRADERGVAALATVREDDDDRAPGQAPAAPLVVVR